MVVDDGAKKSPLVSLIAGGAAGGVECTITYPFEFAKTRVQLRDQGPTTRNPFTVIAKVVQKEGPQALYKGCETLILGTIAKDAIRFISFDTIKEKFKDPETGTLSPLRNLGAGISSGIVASTFAVTPTERIKTALIDDARSEKRFRNAWHATQLLVKEHGLADLYRGYVTTTMKQASTTAVRLGTYNILKDFERVRNIAQTTPVTFANGAVAGTVVVFVTQPFDTLKTRAQSVQGARVMEAFNSVIADYGVKGLWRGSTMRLARRLKKREIDRRCQRQARERTKSRIAYLEGLVESLKQSDGDDRSAALLKRVEDTEKERDALAQALRDVQKAISSCRAVNEKVEPDDDSPQLKYIQQAPADEPESSSSFFHCAGRAPRHHSATASTPYSRPDVTPAMTMPMTISMVAPVHALPPTTMPMRTTPPLPVSLVTSSSEGAIVPACNDDCDCCRDRHVKATAETSNDWRYACTTLLESIQSQTSVITPEEDMLRDDIPVRVVMEGWDAVEQQIGISASWAVLRKIDERIFISCNPVTRLAVLLTMHLLFQYHRDPSLERCAKVPLWFLPRPSCQTQKHSYAINYFVWPGLRERFVFYQHHYCSNIYWRLFTSCLTINWPYDFRDCFVQRWDSGIFEISPLFRECIGNIYNWQMTGDIFARFPELRSDIPCVLQSARPTSNSVQLQLANWDMPQQDRAKKMQQQDKRHQAATAALWDTQAAPFAFSVPDQAAVAAPWMTSTWIL
ncbi:hypothetical protein DV737_g451, partial [Chaetothyriales sp. CBS 132003]